jgi:hypothetical protein
MIIGMLWNGSNFLEAKNYYIRKYKRIPDTVEISPKWADILGYRSTVEGMLLRRSGDIQYGNILVGLEKDVDNLEYLKLKEEK